MTTDNSSSRFNFHNENYIGYNRVGYIQLVNYRNPIESAILVHYSRVYVLSESVITKFYYYY